MNDNIKGAVFDMDGLLIDTEKLYLKYWKQAAAEYGYTMLDEHVFAIRSLARKYSVPKLKGIFGDDFPTEDIRKLRTELINRDIEENGIRLKKGMRELMRFLHENNIKTAVATATNRERTMLYLGKINAENLFDAIICGDMVENGKPQPDIYLTAAKCLGLPPQMCAAFEDSPNGIRSAYAAGCKAVMIPDLTQPDDEIMPLLSAVYPDLEAAIEFFK
jgi:HAD superfamily hydrolase (TIGR01509 family)